jgi:hypothetical protein
MRTLLCCFLAALPLTLSAQTIGTCASPFQARATPGSELALTLRAGDMTIVGTTDSVVRVTCEVPDKRDAGDIKISFAANHLTLRGGPRNQVRFRIEIPRTTGLRIRASAGNLELSGVTGNKDVELNAGNLTVEVGDAGSYRDVDASVWAGDLVATAFGGVRNGLFRNFHHRNQNGSYRLHAALMAGNLTLR